MKGEVVGLEYDTADDVEEVPEPPLAAYPGRVITHAHIKPMRYPITAARGLAGESETPPLRLSLWEIRCTNPSVRRLRLDYHQTPIFGIRAVSMLCASSAGSPHDNQISCFFLPTRSACTNPTHLADKLREIV
jgi:hypothetical protein